MRARGTDVVGGLRIGGDQLRPVGHDELEAVRTNGGEVRSPCDEGDLGSRQRQLGAHEPANGTGTYDTDTHVRLHPSRDEDPNLRGPKLTRFAMLGE